MKVVGILIVIALLGGGGWYYWQEHSKAAAAAAAAGARPSTSTIEKRDIRFAVSAAGEITPSEQVSVRPEVNGRIDLLPVDLGDFVRKGDLLFQLNDLDLKIEKQQREISIARSRLSLDQARRDFERAQMLFNDKLLPGQDFEDARTAFELAKNSTEQAQKELDLTDDKLRKTRVTAPFDCTVLTRPISVGQAVSGSGGFNSGTEVLTIANLNDLVINAHINQADVSRLKSGQEVEVTVEAVPGLKVVGKVERIAPQATIKNNIKGFPARVLLKDVDKRVRPGMTANISIPVASADDVVAAPLAAVFTEFNPETKQVERYAWVKQGEEWERRPIHIGVSDYFFAEITGGLEPGDVVSLEDKSRSGAVRKPSGTSGSKSGASAVSSTQASPAASARPVTASR
ncbi:MAG: efflux RND transporter periplasmic adaptor subunit [Verrucomicrobiales bacterium]|nr:efflux RND transporter periplasmic adaptor subunit [Verrucomicrobiales bacterium]